MVDWNVTQNNMSDEDLEFINLRSEMKENEKASFVFTNVSWTDKAGSEDNGEVITLIDSNTSTATSVWVTPYPDAKFEVSPEQTDGARLGRALARAFDKDGKMSKEDVIASANASGGILNKNDYGDSWAWLWEVKQ